MKPFRKRAISGGQPLRAGTERARIHSDAGLKFRVCVPTGMSAAFAPVNNAEPVGTCFTGIREGPHPPGTHTADRSEFTRAELLRRRTDTAGSAFTRRDYPETFRTCRAGIRKGLPAWTALAADGREFARTGLLHRRATGGAALTAVNDPEAISPGHTSV